LKDKGRMPSRTLSIPLILGSIITLLYSFISRNIVYALFVLPLMISLGYIFITAKKTKEVEGEVKEGPPRMPTIPTFGPRLALRDIVQLGDLVYAGIAEDAVTRELRYVVIEPSVNQEIYNKVKSLLTEELNVDLTAVGNVAAAERLLRSKTVEILRKRRIRMSAEDLRVLLYHLSKDSIHYGKIDPLMRDEMIEDISCDGVKIPVYIWHRIYESIPTNIVFESEDELDSFVTRLAYKAGSHISISKPIADGRLPDGSRVHLTYSTEVTRKGSTFSIRKFRADPLTIVDLIKFGTLSPETAAYLWYVIEKKFSVLVAGGTASGKTTLLNCLSIFILPGLKIVTIEDTPELNLPHENLISAVTRSSFDGTGEVSLFDLLKASLRQRPDVIIVGEVRGEEAYTMFQAMATGHGGLGTIHADSVDGVLERLSTSPMNVPKSLIAATLDVVVMLLKLRIGERTLRKVVKISEILSYDPLTGKVTFKDLIHWNPETDRYEIRGGGDGMDSRVVEKIWLKYGESREKIEEELEKRKRVLEWMVFKGIRKQSDVVAVIREFYSDPMGVYGRAVAELIPYE